MKAKIALLAAYLLRKASAADNVFRLGFQEVDDDSQTQKEKSPPTSSMRIIGGQKAKVNRYPYFVSLEDKFGEIYCGGSLIAPNVVLTAAHCRNGLITSVSIGKDSKFDSTESFEHFEIVEMISHPEYGDGDFYAINDVMLLRLDGIAEAPTVSLNRLEGTPVSGAGLSVMGFGTTDPDFMLPSFNLREAPVNYVPNDVCSEANDQYSGFPPYYGLISEDMMCAAAPGMDSCSGDSGGPLIIRGSSSAADLQVGVVSWGFSCAHPAYPGVYSRISHLSSWIDETTCVLTDGVLEPSKRNVLCSKVAAPTVPTGRPSSSTDSPSASPSAKSTTTSPTSAPETFPPSSPPPTIVVAATALPAPTLFPNALATGATFVPSNEPLIDSITLAPSVPPPNSLPIQTESPTQPNPTQIPTRSPSSRPSEEPSSIPSVQPSLFPSTEPSSLPSGFPSASPTLEPTSSSSDSPTVMIVDNLVPSGASDKSYRGILLFLLVLSDVWFLLL